MLLSIKPGLTGAASMRFSNEEELLANQVDPIRFNDQILYPEKVRINNEYVKNRGFFLDLKIIIYTILGKRLKEEWAHSGLNEGETLRLTSAALSNHRSVQEGRIKKMKELRNEGIKNELSNGMHHPMN